MASITLPLAAAAPPPIRSCHLLALPTELILDIGSHLDPQELSRLMRACHPLNSVLTLRLRALLSERKERLLWDACHQNNTSKLLKAFEAGAAPTAEHLSAACRWGRSAIVAGILDEDPLLANDDAAHSDTPENPTQSILYTTTRFRHLAGVEALLGHGAIVKPPPIYIPCFTNFDPVHYAFFHARDMLPPFIKRGHHLEHSRFTLYRGALGLAVRMGCIGTVKLLLENGSDVNQIQVCGETPLHECCRRRGNIEMVTLLLEAGADVDISDWYSQTPLQVAMCRGHVEAVKLLVKRAKYTVYRMCWFPARCRFNPEWMEGRLECWMILEQAGIYTSDEDITKAPGYLLKQQEGENGEERICDETQSK